MASNGEIYGSQSAESYPCPFGASRWAFCQFSVSVASCQRESNGSSFCGPNLVLIEQGCALGDQLRLLVHLSKF
jgi:hypothetical protein